ncbi:NIPSNAP family protein [Caldimonas sp. KR1-144]|uniref:NIPSNAP family protein n=1 Tax=Caldimonas sp. KR1-144 TaxID=3400911 RepID=UPI003C127026
MMPTPSCAKALPAVIELRQYTLHPGQRDVLVELFEREFVAPQEALGLRVLGTWRDLDDADRFVWMRGFAGLGMRAPALAAFYDGPVWRRHRDAANATMIDSDDVLLLRPLPSPGVASEDWDSARRAPLITTTLCFLPRLADEGRIARFEREIRPLWTRDGARWIAAFETEPARNDFPRLPVREGIAVLAWMAAYADAAAQAAHARGVAASPAWRAWCADLAQAPQTLRLAPAGGAAAQAAASPPSTTSSVPTAYIDSSQAR